MKIAKHIINIIYSILFLVIVGMAGIIGLSAVDTPVNLRTFVVLSGSMEPAIPTGSVVFVRPASEYVVNDVVTVESETNRRNTVTHRIVEVTSDPDIDTRTYVLKGDANEENDREPVPESRVVGKVMGHIPFVGRAIRYAQTQSGFMILVVIPATILAYSELMTIKNEIVRMWRERREKRTENGERRTEDREPRTEDGERRTEFTGPGFMANLQKKLVGKRESNPVISDLSVTRESGIPLQKGEQEERESRTENEERSTEKKVSKKKGKELVLENKPEKKMRVLKLRK